MDSRCSSLNRHETLAKLQAEQFDLLIVGGGITGAGIALDAASRGIKTALVEMQDFAAGTSSRSSKMIHGGLRYLKNMEIRLVAQVGRERAIVHENGPHVTTPEWMILPIYKNGSMGKFTTSIGLSLYDFLARVKKGERKSMLSKDKTLQMEPKFKQEGLLGGGRFVEYRSDDARLTIEVMKEAAAHGATVLNYTKVNAFIYDEAGQVIGVSANDQLNDQTIEIHAKKIVNAAGPWVDTLREKDNSLDQKQMHLTKGVHLIFDQSVFPLRQSIYFDTPDGRMVIAIPRDGKTYVGTTDTDYDKDLTHPRMTVEDLDYVIGAINYIFPNLQIQASDIESSWAGLRPLIHEVDKGLSEISRKDEIWESSSGLVTIAGGKLTGYRKMAETIVDLIASKLQAQSGQNFASCHTKNMPISGGHVGGSKKFKTFMKSKIEQGVALGLHRDIAYRLVKKYGSNIDKLYEIIQNEKEEATKFGLPVEVYAQVMYAITEEFVCTLVDFFWRRTGALLFDIDWVQTWKTAVTALMSEKLGWREEEQERFTMELEKHLHDVTAPVQ